jgi:hypothetical protein
MNGSRTAFAGGFFVISLLLAVLGGALGGFIGGALWWVGLVINFGTVSGVCGVVDRYNFRGGAFGFFLVVALVLGLVSGFAFFGFGWALVFYAVGVTAAYMLAGAGYMRR